MNSQEKFWKIDYATEYISNNQVFDQKKGAEAWSKMLAKAKNLSSILECGCNIGRNISFLERIIPDVEKSIIEISKPAFDLVTKNHNLKNAFHGSILESRFNEQFDLVFTNGVLNHIHPDYLLENMQKINRLSKKYILFGEYFSRTPEVIEYHGKKDQLFKRDFGKFFLENFSASLVDYGFLWGYIYDSAGFDDMNWWLFEKTSK